MATFSASTRPLGMFLFVMASHYCSGTTFPSHTTRWTPAFTSCSARSPFCPGSRTLVPSCDFLHDRRSLSRLYLSGNDEEDGETQADDRDDNDDSYSWAQIQADEKLRKLEFDASIKRKNSILLPQRISQAVTTFGWLFVISGFVLNQTGFAWVRDPSGGVRIGTLDERDFQKEIIKERRQSNDEVGKETPLSISRAEIANKHISCWIEQQHNSRFV